MTDRNRSWAEEAVAACLCHVVGADGKDCRNCGISAAWMSERNRRNHSTYEVPGSHPRFRFIVGGEGASIRHIRLAGQDVTDEYIEVVW